jgi:pimeloyl-ACP methyl ester carboxylesterase
MFSQTVTEALPRRATSVWREWLQAFRANHIPQTLQTHGHTWRYLTGGRGADVALLLHGSECDAESLFGAMTLLERRYTVLAPTYPTDMTSLDELCAGLAALLESVGSPALVVGYSLGGYVAQALAERRPDLAPRLALCNTGGPALTALRMVRLQYGAFAAMPEPLLRGALHMAARVPLWLESPGLDAPDHDFWRSYLAEMSARVSKTTMLAHGKLIADFLATEPQPPVTLAAMPGHVLMLDAEHDRTIEPAERAALRACYPHASQRTLSGLGHLSMMTQPQAYIAAIDAQWPAC